MPISKQQREHGVFLRFARVCTHYKIDIKTIKIGDSPDVKCKLLDGNEKWFELTEIIDPEYVKVTKTRVIFEKILQDFFLKDQVFPVTFKNKKVTIGFSRTFTRTRDLKRDLPKLLEYLHYLNVKGIKDISPKNKCNFIDYITIRDSKFGIKIRVPNAQFVGIPIKDRLDDKFIRNYATGCDLLLYYDKLTVFDRAVPYEEVKNYIVCKKKNPFTKIWIFSLKEDSIIFEYPSNGE